MRKKFCLKPRFESLESRTMLSAGAVGTLLPSPHVKVAPALVGPPVAALHATAVAGQTAAHPVSAAAAIRQATVTVSFVNTTSHTLVVKTWENNHFVYHDVKPLEKTRLTFAVTHPGRAFNVRVWLKDDYRKAAGHDVPVSCSSVKVELHRPGGGQSHLHIFP
jgi:hypothetical protein